MAILDILKYPDPRLKTKAPAVDDIKSAEVQSMIQDMLETLIQTEHCGGLAATQLDIKNPRRIFVYNDFDEANPSAGSKPLVIVNPEILETEGEVYEPEGCMSVYPNAIQALVKRPAKTTIRALDQFGTVLEITRTGYLAKLFQHEVDHLNGTVYIDHLKPLKRQMVDKKIEKVIKKGK